MFEDRFLEDLSAYAAGALAVTDRLRVEKHLAEGCDLCESELLMFREAANRLVYELPNVPLRPALKETIRFRVAKEASPKKIRLKRIAAAAALFVLAFAAYFYWTGRESGPQWLRDPSVELAVLNGMAPAERAKGKVIWNPVLSRGLFYASALPGIDNEKSYQIWIIDRRGPTSAGVFETDAAGNAVIVISAKASSKEPLQFAVTIEPKGGVPQPTGSMVLAGKIL